MNTDPSMNQQVVRTERIWLKRTKRLQEICHSSKNVYNEGLYHLRQQHFNNQGNFDIEKVEKILRNNSEYQSLPQSSFEKLLVFIKRVWTTYHKQRQDWKNNPHKYTAEPKIPYYKPKNSLFMVPINRNELNIVNSDVSIPFLDNLLIKTHISDPLSIMTARLVPKGYDFVFEIVHKKIINNIRSITPKRIIGIDVGVTNLATIVNNIGEEAIVIKGGVVKSINQYYNKERGKLQSIYAKQNQKNRTKLKKMVEKRNRKIDNYFHEVSRYIINYCFEKNIDTIVIGRNKYWKQKSGLGKRIQQNFTFIPYHRLIQKIEYKAEEEGIKVLLTREDYTSKCSFLDNEPIRKMTGYAGKRISRGLFESAAGFILNSDVNGAYNILVKAVPKAFDGIEGVRLHPVRWKGNILSKSSDHLIKAM